MEDHLDVNPQRAPCSIQNTPSARYIIRQPTEEQTKPTRMTTANCEHNDI